MKIAVFGATGFVGKTLLTRLGTAGHETVALDVRKDDWKKRLQECEAVVNLAGAPIFGKRWTEARKQLIVASRVDGTRDIVSAMGQIRKHDGAKCRVLVSTSAVGYYGADRGDTPLDESSSEGHDFLAEVCLAWEREARKAEELGVRTAILRFGVVLGHDGGALAQMLPPFKAFVGGPIGNGRQWMSWIHKEDLVAMILLALSDEKAKGVWNATAPAPVTNKEFSKILARVLHRPCLFAVPPFVLKLVFGEAAEVLTKGQKALPQAPLRAGYVFRHAQLQEALEDLLR